MYRIVLVTLVLATAGSIQCSLKNFYRLLSTMFWKPVPRLVFAILTCWLSSQLVSAQDTNDVAPLGIGDAGQLVSLAFESSEGASSTRVLQGSEPRYQLVLTANYSSGQQRDLTRDAVYKTEPDNVIAIDSTGLVSTLGNGIATITATAGPLSASTQIHVESFEQDPEVNFSERVVPILTKYGCNSGGCHGSAGGQNGFRLSLLGFEPAEDYERLVKESRGRRWSIAAPDQSLLLQKAVGTVPHGGGTRLEIHSPEYKTLLRWITSGANFGEPNAAKVAKVEVLPAQRMMGAHGQQQLSVIAHFTDGTIEDVTTTAVYEANVPEMASVTKHGLVKTMNEPGDVGVMIRYQSQVAVFRATIPLGAPVDHLPPQRNLVDEFVFKKLKLLGLPPSEVCDDSTFVRRVTIDLASRLPTATEAETFLADTNPNKRDQWIDQLLASNDYADTFASKWSALLRNKRDDEQMELSRPGTYAFHGWIRQAIQENRPYDEFVSGILTASGEASENPATLWYRSVKEISSQVEDVAQLFLGQRIQCAKCHHHPFEKWSTADYVQFTAFFSQLGRKKGEQISEERIFHRSGLATAAHPKSAEKLLPSGLGGPQLSIQPDQDPRQFLAEWMTARDNPFFARALVNRYWKHFFGRGLVDPEDDMRETNPPTNPELLSALTEHFVQSGYDMKNLVRTICESTTYQLSAKPNQYNMDDRQNYSRYYPRRMMAESLCDSIDVLTGSVTRFQGMPVNTRAVQLPDSSFQSYFLTVFGRPKGESACDCERGSDSNLAQGLHLINSDELRNKIAAGDGRAVQLANDKDRAMTAKIRELYLTAFSRPPTEQEEAFVEEYIDLKSKANPAAAQQALEDILWSLLNTKEFLFNH